MAYGVTPEMIASFGPLVFELSLNRQVRRGDPVRALDLNGVAAQRDGTGLSDAEIAARLGLTPEQVRFIRVVSERRRFRTDQYRKLFGLGTGRRWRAERYVDPVEQQSFSDDAMALRQTLRFRDSDVRRYVENGWWDATTLPALLARHAGMHGDRPAIITEDPDAEPLTFAALAERVDRLARGLAALGIRRGDGIAIQLANRAEYIVGYLAAATIGAVLTTVHLPYREREIRSLLAHSRVRAVICEPRIGDFEAAKVICALKNDLPRLDHVIVAGPAPAGAVCLDDVENADHEGFPLAPPVASDPLLLLYTSGTTQAPKAVPLTSQNMVGNGRLSASELGLRADDVICSAAPFSHLLGLFNLHMAMNIGAASVLLPRFRADALAETVARARPSILIASPAHFATCLAEGLLDREAFSSLRMAIFSGSRLGPDLAARIRERLPDCRLIQLWGMTETQAATYIRPDDPPELAGESAGRPNPGTEIRVVDEDGNPLGPDIEGQLQVRGANVFPGYFDNDAANAEAFTPDGWFRTGDLARIDADGNLYITGRSKDLINRGGVKFNPGEIEGLLEAYPGIAQAAIVPLPDPVLGERACCVIVAEGTKPTLDEINRYLLSHGIAKNKLPERLETVSEMPMTPTRKIIKARLVAAFAQDTG